MMIRLSDRFFNFILCLVDLYNRLNDRNEELTHWTRIHLQKRPILVQSEFRYLVEFSILTWISVPLKEISLPNKRRYSNMLQFILIYFQASFRKRSPAVSTLKTNKRENRKWAAAKKVKKGNLNDMPIYGLSRRN